MSNEAAPMPNVKQAVPFFAVSNMAASTRYYVDSLGFTITQRWTDDYFLTMAQLVQCQLSFDKLELL